MSDIRVKGFDDITFWREDSIGLIVIRSSPEGRIRKKTLEELMIALSSASIDSSIGSIAITGQNDLFFKDIVMNEAEDLPALLESLRALASLFYSIDKPTFTILNGDATDLGYELALLTDIIISSPKVTVGFSSEYNYKMAGSLSSLRFRSAELKESSEGVNCDYVFKYDNLLGDAKNRISVLENPRLALSRRNRLRFIKEAITEEHLMLLAKSNISKDKNALNVLVGKGE
ncbi:MAG: enoyl-CoA hydratase-related protein [Candidatus Thermoplasmatota archaeon]|nr:enoyl-CoA hydratase-related protein [Candidatus Thermoplasmatota archaeon]